MGMLLVSISCSESVDIVHYGEWKANKKIELLDSVIVDASNTSGRGNFFMQDSSIYFADSYYMSIFQYDFVSASCVGQYFGRGQGPNELPSFMYAYPFKNGNRECFVMDNSLGMYTYREGDFSLEYKGRIDFGWEHLSRNDYTSPSVYNLMEMTDFGIDLTYLNDSTILLPINLINRYLDKVSEERYEEGHIFAELNSKNMKVKKVWGDFPNVYKQRPTPFFEFFQYAMNKDTLYVNHATDSLIYVYKYPNNLLYTVGYESSDVNRNYTVGYDVEMSNFKSDIRIVGVNSGLLYVPEKHLLFRTTLKRVLNREVVIQAYSNNDLILDADMPNSFKLLGFWDDYFYGVSLLPKEDANGNIHFIFYRFKIEGV
ncbi:hypothetical protein DWW14_21715 [Bacteroides uniformis]|uniref:Uncharacterized protein n=2 Tax=Bacteroides uniformis TaxID=820 RepID=A0A412X425_BACUN|nr:hypothetical protein DWW14_21715 [Bacteroides uniformis]